MRVNQVHDDLVGREGALSTSQQGCDLLLLSAVWHIAAGQADRSWTNMFGQVWCHFDLMFAVPMRGSSVRSGCIKEKAALWAGSADAR